MFVVDPLVKVVTSQQPTVTIVACMELDVQNDSEYPLNYSKTSSYLFPYHSIAHCC